MPLMTSFWTGVSGLQSNQASLNTTSHNVVNANTSGYVRQQVLTADLTYNNLGWTAINTLQSGLGTEVESIRQMRNVFLDQSYRKEVGRQGFYEAQYDAVTEIETLFGELEGVQFQESIDDLWSSFQELAKEPDSIVGRASLIQNSVQFVERAELIYEQIQSYQSNLNTQISNKVDRINEIGYEIKELNRIIRKYESGAESANDYRDERNSLLDELGALVKITYKEDENGVVLVNVEGTSFLTEDKVYEMSTEPVNEQSALLKPIWSGNGGEDVFNFDVPCTTAANTDIGSLKGLMLARGDGIGRYIDIPVAPVESDYGDDEDAYSVAVAKFEEATRVYNDTTDESIILTVQAQFDQLIHGIATAVNDVLCPNITATWTSTSDIVWKDKKGNEVEVDFDIDSSELEDYATPIYDSDGAIEGYTISILDRSKASVGMDADSTYGEALFNRKSTERYNTVTLSDALGDDLELYIYNSEDPKNTYSLFSLGEVEVNPNILKNSSLIPLSENTGTGDFALKTCQELVQIWNEGFATLDPNTLTVDKFVDYYVSFTANIANRGQTMKSIADNQETTAQGVDNQRSQVMSVSTDEELTLMLKYQHGYNAASRYITVVDEMLEHVITKL